MRVRRKTRQVRIGKVRVGGLAPVSIQSMTNTVTADVAATVAQIGRLSGAGCEIVRVAVKTFDDADAVGRIKKCVKVPIVADIHFDHRLAIRAIRAGADKVRINPGNMTDRAGLREVALAAKSAGIPIRIGLNSGSIDARRAKRDLSPKAFLDSALSQIRFFEKEGMRDLVISLKGADVPSTIEAYRAMAKRCDYPFHLGVTATGTYLSGVVKSSIGIGTLLTDGIGDTIRVSLTADPVEEVVAARKILSALDLRSFGPEIVSCPTCGRCQVGLIDIVNELDGRIRASGSKKRVKVAVMGCEVNGPGEAKEADVGIAFGKGYGMLFKKGKTIKRVAEKDAVKILLKNISTI